MSSKNLDFDVNTNKILVNKASWLINKLFLSTIEKQLACNVSNNLDKAKLETENAINNLQINKLIKVYSKINNLTIMSINTQTDFIKINTKINGTLNMEFNK